MFLWDDVLALAENVSESARAERQSQTQVHDVINMQYTSGTTGFPKGVMLTHHNLVNNGKIIGEYMHFSAKDRLCITVPLFHCFGCVLGVMASVTNDAAMVIIDHFNPVKVMQALDAEKCTAVHGVPTMFIAMLEHPDFAKFDFSSLRTGIMAGSPCPVEVMKAVVSRNGARERSRSSTGRPSLRPALRRPRRTTRSRAGYPRSAGRIPTWRQRSSTPRRARTYRPAWSGRS